MLARLSGVVHAIAMIVLATALLEPVAIHAAPLDRLNSQQQTAALQALQDPDAAVGREAVSWLSDYQVSDARLVTALARYLDKKQPRDTRGLALTTLGNMGAVAAGAVPDIAPLLADYDNELRSAAVEALTKLAAAGAPVAPQLVALLARPDINALSAVPEALGRLGAASAPVAPQVAGLLKDPKTNVRIEAAEALGAMGAASVPFAPELAVLLKDPNQEIRAAGAQALGDMGAASAPFAAQVAALLKDPVNNVRGAAVAALGMMGAASAPYAREIAPLLKDSDSYSRAGAARSLGHMGAVGAPFAPQVAPLLNDSVDAVRAAAAEALGHMGSAGAAFAPQVAALLKHPFSFVDKAAAQALAGMGRAGAAFAPQIAALLTNSQREASSAAADALGQMYAAGSPVGLQIAAVLKNANEDGRSTAAEALGRMDVAYAPLLVTLLKNTNGDVRVGSAYALGEMGVAAAAFAPQVAELLKDSDEYVRGEAATTLSYMGGQGAAFAPQIASLLKETSGNVRYDAARSLGRMGAGAFASQLSELLMSDEYPDVRGAAAQGLGQMGAAGAPFAATIARRLNDADAKVVAAAAYALGQIGPAGAAFAPQLAKLWIGAREQNVREEAEQTLAVLAQAGPLQVELYPLLNATHQWPQEAQSFFLGCYLIRKNSPQELLLIRWLGIRAASDRPAVPADRRDIVAVLDAFTTAWDATKDFPNLRQDMAMRIPELVRSPQVRLEQRRIDALESRLSKAGFKSEVLAVAATQHNDKTNRWAYSALRVLGVQVAFWVALIFVYPRWPWAQSFFFWNKWARRFLGLGYVGALITLVPWLRRRMFLPFRDSLLPPGILEQFSERSYFPDSEVILETHRPGSQRPVPLKEAVASIRGQVVLKGQSGLGKTLLLLRLASRATEPVVFLRATECKGGVEAAIQRKLHGQLRDKSYLQSLIYAGGLKVLIDGVNEAPPEARVAITHFVEQFFKGDFILTTQPMGRESWEPPATARVCTLQPLRPEQIEAFLLKQWESFADGATEGPGSYLDQAHYKAAVLRYIASIAHDVQGGESATARLLTLSNPMDATLAAELLARNETPDTFHLVDQGYRVMAQSFQEERGRAFPLNAFAERVYEWRTSGEPYIKTEGFEPEVAALAENRLMIRRTEVLARDQGETTVNRWFFRHDKIMEFFLLPAFMADRTHVHRYEDHMREYEPFIGVYELLAVRLPDDEEQRLRERLIETTAESSSSELLIRYETARRLRPLARQRAAAAVGPGEESAVQESEGEIPEHTEEPLARRALDAALEFAEREGEREERGESVADGLISALDDDPEDGSEDSAASRRASGDEFG